jgi:hypothetical protein
VQVHFNCNTPAVCVCSHLYCILRFITLLVHVQVACATIDKSTKLDERRDEIAALKMELTEVKDDFKGMH